MAAPVSIKIDDVEYVQKGTENQMAEKVDGLEYVIVRTHSAGVFAGYLASKNGKEVTLFNARRLWYWEGAASISQMAVDGTSKPNSCKFPCETPKIDLTEAIEVVYATEKARLSIASVPAWKQ